LVDFEKMSHTQTCTELSKFLTNLSLSQYTAMFKKEGAVCVEDLKMFSEEELRKLFNLGIVEARRLLRALHPSDEAKETAQAAQEETAQASQAELIQWDDFCKDEDDDYVDSPLFDNGEIVGVVRRFSSGVYVVFFFYVDQNGELVWTVPETKPAIECTELFFPETPFPGHIPDDDKEPCEISLTPEIEKELKEAQEVHHSKEAKLLDERDALLVQLQQIMGEFERAQMDAPASKPEFFSFKTGTRLTLFYVSIHGIIGRTRNIIILFSYEGKQDNNLEAGIMDKLKKFYLEHYPESNQYSGIKICDAFSRTFFESEGPLKIETVKDDFNMCCDSYPTRSLEIEQISYRDKRNRHMSTLEQIQQEKRFFTFKQLLSDEFPNATSSSKIKNQVFQFQKTFEGEDDTRLPPILV